MEDQQVKDFQLELEELETLVRLQEARAFNRASTE